MKVLSVLSTRGLSLNIIFKLVKIQNPKKVRRSKVQIFKTPNIPKFKFLKNSKSPNLKNPKI